MSQVQIIEVTRKQLDEGILPPNQVLVESAITSEGLKTKGGVTAGFNEDTVYAEGDNAWNADLCIPYGTVYRAPQKLYFNEKDDASMMWECDMELQRGDRVWFSIIESYNAMTFKVEDKYYKLIPYSDIYVAKRFIASAYHEVLASYQTVYDDDRYWQVICLNGYVLCEPVNLKKISDLDVVSEDKIDTTKARVKFFGTPNKRYKDKSSVDFQELHEGDMVLLAKGTPLMFLERKKYFAQFDGDNLYWVIQRRKIMAILNR